MEPLNPSVSTQLAKVNKQAAEFIYLFLLLLLFFLAVQFSDGDLT
jgi:hypothetical protein